MNTEKDTNADIAPLNPIRVETALSRYPVHRLAKHGDIVIDIQEKSEGRELSIKWEVSYNSKYGQSGPLAYKLDTLIINRRIEEAARPIPRIIKLGSLHEICRELGISEGKNVVSVKRSLYQNASTFITAKIRYRQNGGSEKSLEAGFTRYQVVFTGEELPDGRKADAVYIVMNDIYMQVINGAITRPLDYDYLKSLPPAPQRFYELLSYQVYATIKNDRPRAKLLYSEFCTYAPQTRYFDWEHARKQMAKVHSEHRKSGYVAKIDYEQTVDSDGKPDWLMLYQPGLKARAEYRTFARRGGPVVLQVEPFTADPLPQLAAREASPLEAELVGQGITPAIAAALVRDYDVEKIRAQLEILDWYAEKKPGKIADPAAWLVIAIKNGHATPKGFVSRAERQRREEVKQAKEREAAEKRRREREQDARDQAEKQAILAYWESLTSKQQAKLQAAADAQAAPEDLAQQTGPLKSFGQTIRRQEYIRQLLRDRQPAEA